MEAGAEGLDAHLEVGECRRPKEPQLPLSFFNILSLSEHNSEKGGTREHRDLGR